jgi:hypothetical protein
MPRGIPLSPAVSAGELPCQNISVRDVLLASSGGCGLWLPLSRLFCGVAFWTGRPQGLSRVACAGCRLLPEGKRQRDRTTYATIFVKPTALLTAGATPPHRQNQPSVALSTSDCMSETANYKGQRLNCQARLRYWFHLKTSIQKQMSKVL